MNMVTHHFSFNLRHGHDKDTFIIMYILKNICISFILKRKSKSISLSIYMLKDESDFLGSKIYYFCPTCVWLVHGKC